MDKRKTQKVTKIVRHNNNNLGGFEPQNPPMDTALGFKLSPNSLIL